MIAKILRTFSYYNCSGLILLLSVFPIIVCAALPERWRYNRFLFFIAYVVYRVMLWSTFLPIKIVGKENLPKGPAIYAANHQSALDIPLIGSLLYFKPHIWFLKHELTQLPLIGWVFNRIGVSVDRRSPRRAMKSLTEGLALLENKNRSLIIFPEGARFTDGKVHDFLWGFAIIAKRIKRPVVPIVIKHAYKAYPPGSFFILYHPITLVIGEPFEFRPDETDEEFISRVHRWFIETAE